MRIDHISAAYNMRRVSHDDMHLEETILMQSMIFIVLKAHPGKRAYQCNKHDNPYANNQDLYQHMKAQARKNSCKVKHQYY